MIDSFPGLFLQFFSFNDLIYQWENVGVFDLLLPFLLVFAVLFAILTNSRILGDHKGINAIISIVIGLFVVRVAFISEFLGAIFANLGIALAVLIVLLILTGLFVTTESRKGIFKMWMGVGAITVAFVVISTLNQFAWFGSFWWQNNWTNVMWIAIIVIVLITFFSGEDKNKSPWGELEPVRKMFTGGR